MPDFLQFRKNQRYESYHNFGKLDHEWFYNFMKIIELKFSKILENKGQMFPQFEKPRHLEMRPYSV